MPTKGAIGAKVADINRLLSHQFTKEELDGKLRKQGTLDNRAKFLKRIELENSIKIARAIGDEAEITRLEDQLADLSTPKLAFGASLFKPQHAKQTEQERLAEINLRNQKLNYENVRRAQLEEKKASRKAVLHRAIGENKNLAVPVDRSGSVTPAGTDRSNTPSQNEKHKGGISKIRHRNKDDENIAALDLDIDIDI